MHQCNLSHAIGAGLPYGQDWARGDIIGVMIDLDMGVISFMRNGVSLGQAFSHIRRLEYYPAASLSYGEQVPLPWEQNWPCQGGYAVCVQSSTSTFRCCTNIERIGLEHVRSWAAY